MLVKASGRVFPRQDLFRAVLDREFSPFDRSIDAHVSHLRRKLGPLPNGTQRIRTVRNVGYLYAQPASPTAHRKNTYSRRIAAPERPAWRGIEGKQYRDTETARPEDYYELRLCRENSEHDPRTR